MRIFRHFHTGLANSYVYAVSAYVCCFCTVLSYVRGSSFGLSHCCPMQQVEVTYAAYAGVRCRCSGRSFAKSVGSLHPTTTQGTVSHLQRQLIQLITNGILKPCTSMHPHPSMPCAPQFILPLIFNCNCVTRYT